MSGERMRASSGVETWLARFPAGAAPVPTLVEPLRTRRAALELFNTIAHRPYAFLLDSALDVSGQGNFSYLGCEPAAVLRCSGQEMEFVAGRERLAWRGDPFEALEYVLASFRSSPPPGAPPFVGGAVGYFGYDLRDPTAPLVRRAAPNLSVPDMVIGLYDAVVAHDHETAQTYLCSTGYPEREPNASR